MPWYRIARQASDYSSQLLRFQLDARAGLGRRHTGGDRRTLDQS